MKGPERNRTALKKEKTMSPMRDGIRSVFSTADRSSLAINIVLPAGMPEKLARRINPAASALSSG